tara:strand:+ start:382 stop:1293 length:912 start_codon:yes stop_codon:yes gene_type:complete
MLITMNQPLVSIIIVTWNRKEDILDALNAIDSQTYSNLEIVVVDNGSSDGTVEEIRRLYPGYKLVCLSSNVGCEEGFNVGIANSTGSILIFLDSDAFFEDNGIAKIVERFNKYPDLGIIDPRIYNYFSKEIQNEPKNWPPQDRMFTGCAVGIKKEVIDNTGLRPKNYFIYASEPDVCIRALDFGYKIQHFNDIVAYHKESPVKRFSSKFYYYNTRNILWLICKYYPIFPAIREVIFHLSINFLLSLKTMSLHYYFLGLFEGIFKLPYIIKNERRPLKRWYLGRVYPSLKQIIKILMNRSKGLK